MSLYVWISSSSYVWLRTQNNILKTEHYAPKWIHWECQQRSVSKQRHKCSSCSSRKVGLKFNSDVCHECRGQLNERLEKRYYACIDTKSHPEKKDHKNPATSFSVVSSFYKDISHVSGAMTKIFHKAKIAVTYVKFTMSSCHLSYTLRHLALQSVGHLWYMSNQKMLALFSSWKGDTMKSSGLTENTKRYRDFFELYI